MGFHVFFFICIFLTVRELLYGTDFIIFVIILVLVVIMKILSENKLTAFDFYLC